jgi:hypothetical protein
MIESSTIEALIMTLMITFGIIFVTFLVNVLTLPGITRDIVVSIKSETEQWKKDK